MNEEIRLLRWFDSLSFMRYVRMSVYAARSGSVRSHQNWGVEDGRANMNSVARKMRPVSAESIQRQAW